MQNRLQTTNTAWVAWQQQPSFYSQSCRFPGCDGAASRGADGGEEASLCLEHERLRFYSPNEFASLCEANDPARVRPSAKSSSG
jgi:hypothetical protein